MQFRDLHRQYEALKPAIDAALLAAAASGAYIMGPQVAQLEEQLAAYVGVKHCVACANGTDALSLALMAWGVGEGDAVFVPDFTFFSSAEVVAHCGATPVFVDVEKSTYNISVVDLEAKYAALPAGLKPRAVVAVDLFGLPADYAALQAFASRHGLLVLEDAAQGFGGSIDGRMACSFGDIATTSFFPAKPLGCYGDGGAVFTDNDEWASLLRSFRVHGKGTGKYDNVRIGLNSRLDTLQAAVLQVKFKAFEDYELDAVNRVAALYDSHLKGRVATPHIPDGYRSSWAQYTVQLPDRDAVKQALQAEGIPTMVYYPKPMSAQTAFAAVAPLQGPCPNAAELASTVLSLPMHPYMNPDEVAFVSQKLLSAI
ncbi:MAG: DegT/DnrJ/EryC1/StrS family aminotransferase [Bacteroidales bacterium]|nr:DegT/DnrJ/EryC1/StrS family aminotransferase [Bacteroidales bacterium]